METIESILNSVSDTIYERGEDYYRFGNILEIKNNDSDYAAEVEGSNGETYTVNIEMNNCGRVESFDCDCPYDYSSVCKHIVAVMLAIQNGEGTNNTSIEERLNQLSKDELVNLLTDLSRDYKIKEKLNNRLNALLNNDYDALNVIDSIIDDYSEDDGYVNYYSCYDMCEEINDAVNSEYQCFERDGSIKHIQNLMDINRRIISIMDYCDDSDGGISMVLSTVSDYIHNACMTIYNSKDKETCTICLKMLCSEAENKGYDYWFETRLELVHIAMLFSEYDSKLVLRSIDSLINKCKEDYEYYFDETIILKYQFLCKTQGQKAADTFILNYLGIDGVCEFLVKRYIDKEKYEDAEKLCLDKIKTTEYPNKWNSLLSNIYEKSKQFEKQLNIELKVLLNGKAEKYDVVKKLMQRLDLWEKVYADLLSELSKKLLEYSYAEILIKEGEYEKLLDLVKKHRHLIEYCFKTFAKYYPEEADNMYYDYIVLTAAEAGSRPQYQLVCQKIAVLYDAGGKHSAKQLIDFLKNKYPRKTAFVNELNKTSQKLKI